jgi:hypothetical protein
VEFPEVPVEIPEVVPTTDTNSAQRFQEEYSHREPFDDMDLPWCALEHDIPVTETARVIGLTEEKTQRVLYDLVGKRNTMLCLRNQLIKYGKIRNA